MEIYMFTTISLLLDVLRFENNVELSVIIGDPRMGQSPRPSLLFFPWKRNCHSLIFAKYWAHLLRLYPTWKGNPALKLFHGMGCLTFGKDDQYPLLCVYVQLLWMKEMMMVNKEVLLVCYLRNIICNVDLHLKLTLVRGYLRRGGLQVACLKLFHINQVSLPGKNISEWVNEKQIYMRTMPEWSKVQNTQKYFILNICIYI